MALNVDIDMRVDPESEVSMSVEDGDEVSFGVAEAIVVKDHATLENRDLPNQHPISAITGLAEALANIDSMLVVTLTPSGYRYVADKTYAEISEAYPNVAVVLNQRYLLPAYAYPQGGFKFITTNVIHEGTYIYAYTTSADIHSDDTVTVGEIRAEVPTFTSELQNDSGFVTADGVGNIVVDMNAYSFILVVMGGTAMLFNNNGQPTTFLDFASRFAGAIDKVYVQVLNGVTVLTQAQARVFTVTYGDFTTATVKLTSIDDGTVYTAVMTDSGSGLVGTFSSQTIPTATSDLTNDSGYITISDVPTPPVTSVNGRTGAVIGLAEASSLSTVATTGSYNDLTDKPTIPTVPTNVSAFTNDAGYLVANDLTEATDADVIAIVV